MELIKHLERNPPLPASQDSETLDEPQRLELVEKWRANLDIRPLDRYLNPDNIVQANQMLPYLTEIAPKTRGHVDRMIEFLFEGPENYRKSFKAICECLEISYVSFWKSCHQRPSILRFINLIVSGTAALQASGRIDMATTQAAIDGQHQDRRLYYELQGRLKGAQRKDGGAVKIVFQQNMLARPSAEGSEASQAVAIKIESDD